MRLTSLFCLFPLLAVAAPSYTEFYCDASVSANNTNINAGSTTGAPVYSAVNGNWDGTSVYTPTDGSTPANTVSAGMWMSVFYDGSTNLVQAGTMGGIIGLVTNVAAGANGTITIDRRTVSGTQPSSSATGRSVRVGGSWAGPYGTIGFPFDFIANGSTNSSLQPRVNFKNASSYVITAAMTHSLAGPVLFQGYASTPGDGGRASILDNTTAASYVLFTLSGAHNVISDFIFSSSFSSGTSVGVSIGGSRCYARNIVVHDVRSTGLSANGNGCVIEECEAYLCDKANTAGISGIRLGGAGCVAIRCISHDNSGNANGFQMDGAATSAFHCIADSNGKDGFLINGSSADFNIINCDAYNNGDNGIDMTAAGVNYTILIENCNFIKNATWGINSSGSSASRCGAIINCGFGSGTSVNLGGNIASLQGVQQIGNITYPDNALPWIDPANGDFRINLSAAKAAGRGAFTETQASYSGTVAYPDIGAAQNPSTNTPGSWTFAQ